MSKTTSIQPVHFLKIWPEHFKAIKSGQKTFEVRLNDRDFQINDLLYLEEYIFNNASYTGKAQCVEVVYILLGGLFGIDKDYVVMSIKLT